MHTTYKPASTKNPPTFPLLARFVGRDAGKPSFVVLFSTLTRGTVVHFEEGYTGSFPVGLHKDCWVDCDDSEDWAILPPGTEVTLIQS